MRLDLAVDESDRRQAAVAEADVGQPAVTVEVDDERQVIERRPPAVVTPHLARHAVDLEAQLGEQPAERPVQLEAPPATPTLDDLGVRRRHIGRHAAAVEHVEVLERHGDEVGHLQGGQLVSGWSRPTARQSEPGEVPLGVHGSSQAERRRRAIADNARRPSGAARMLRRQMATPARIVSA